MITMYTLKYLTYHKDTLPALSGIANRLRNGGQYYAGMWEDNMAQSLLWYTTVKEGRWPARPDSYVAPSFAWPSVIGPKAFLNCSTLEPKFKIISVSCSPRGDNPLGELIEGSILLNAAILEAVFVNGFDDPIRGNIFCVSDERGELCQYATLKCEGTGHFIFHPDGGEDRNMVAGTQLWCLRLFAGNTPEQYSCGLVLRRARFDETSFSHLTRYRRVGIFASIRNRHFIDSKSGNFKVI
jgi:hypothetical protein